MLCFLHASVVSSVAARVTYVYVTRHTPLQTMPTWPQITHPNLGQRMLAAVTDALRSGHAKVRLQSRDIVCIWSVVMCMRMRV